MDNQRILVVDDDVEIAQMLCTFLESQGYECATALDGVSAPLKVNNFKPHLVILDFMMPGADGARVYDRMGMSVMSDGIPVIFLSAQPLEVVKAAVKPSPKLSFMKKPVELVKLLLEIRKYLGGPKPKAEPDDDDAPRERTIIDLDS